MTSEKMHAIVVEKYGDMDHLVAREVPKPGQPEGEDLLVRVKACSVNPVDIKVRKGIYDDYPDYYDRVPKDPYQTLGFDASGTIEAVGPDASHYGFKAGDAVFFCGSPVRHGSNAEFMLVHAGSVAHKPKNLSFKEAAAMPLTWITAYEALVERMEIKKGEKAALLIVNGSGGVGSVASQIARSILRLPIIITTTSRPETTDFSKRMGATHTINHHYDLVRQIQSLNLPKDTPLKYVFITHSTDPYLAPAAEILAPFGKVCSIVQTERMDKMYGSKFLAKSLSFHWCLLGTKPVYGVDTDSHGKILEELRELLEKGEVQCTMTKQFKLTMEGLRKAHEVIEGGSSMGKLALGVDIEGEGDPFR